MKLNEWLKQYRKEHGMSMQAFADLCGYSKAYIGQLEKGINPKTGKEISPTIQTLDKIAKSVGMTLDVFLKLLDSDQPVTLSAPAAPIASTDPLHLTFQEETHIKKFRRLDDDGKNMIEVMIDTRLAQLDGQTEEAQNTMTSSASRISA